jgi:hypothetical protein
MKKTPFTLKVNAEIFLQNGFDRRDWSKFIKENFDAGLASMPEYVIFSNENRGEEMTENMQAMTGDILMSKITDRRFRVIHVRDTQGILIDDDFFPLSALNASMWVNVTLAANAKAIVGISGTEADDRPTATPDEAPAPSDWTPPLRLSFSFIDLQQAIVQAHDEAMAESKRHLTELDNARAAVKALEEKLSLAEKKSAELKKNLKIVFSTVDQFDQISMRYRIAELEKLVDTM